MNIWLEVVSTDGTIRSFEHAGPVIRIGRSPDCELSIADKTNGRPTISGPHARIELTSDGAILADLESKNGTFLNDRQIHRNCRVEVGDHIRLGKNGPHLRVVRLQLPASTATVKQSTCLNSAAPACGRPIGFAAPSSQAAVSPTRMMLVRLQRRHRKYLVALAAGLVMAVGIGVAIYHKNQADSWQAQTDAREAQTSAQQAQTDARLAQEQANKVAVSMPVPATEVIRRVMPSTALILTARAQGTGALIDANRRLLLTAYHVVAEQQAVHVWFSEFGADGRTIGDKAHYLGSRPIKGKVVYEDSLRDLALIELEYVPLSAVELPIAAASPAAGEPVHTIGNPGASGAFFVSNSGSVRQVVRKSGHTTTGQLIDAFKVEVQNPINGGDSGGPLFTNRGELVGVNSTARETIPDGNGGLRLVHLVSDCIDVREVHAVLQRFRQYR